MIDQPSLAILIDCWFINDAANSAANRTYKNIINFLDDNDSIETVVLASYNCKKEMQTNKFVWYKNYRKIFHNDQNPRKIKDLNHIHHYYFQRENDFVEEKTHPLILEYVNDKKMQLSMTWGWELDFYLTLNPLIKNVYVLGVAWDNCVKIRPLGYDAVNEIPNINVLTHTDCSVNMDSTSVDLDTDTNWYKITDKIYCLRK